ncbi:MAG: proprotein convertase P-domain-containing protein [Thermoguttaceae bacterium]
MSDDPDNGVVNSCTKVAISDNGEAAVFYTQKRGGTPYYDAYVRRHDGAGWQEIVKVDTEDLGDVGAMGTMPSFNASKGRAGIAMDDSGNIMGVWQQTDGVFTNIWSAKFDRSTSTWSPAAKLEDAAWDAIQPVVAMNGSGVATTVWVQPDNTLTHVYANRTTVDGSSPLANAPVADAGGPYLVVEGGSVTLDASGTTDPDAGDMLTYEWDLNYEGATFDVDAIGQTMIFNAASWAPSTVTVAVRATDSTLPVALWDIDTATVTVQAATSSISYNYTGLPVTIGDLTTVTTTVNVPDSGLITELQVRVNLTHANPADLTAWLVSPDGIRLNITGSIKSADQVYDVTYPLGTSAADLTRGGVWTLNVNDGVKNRQRGTLINWSLLVTPASVSGASMPLSGATDADQALLSWLDPDSSDEEESDLLPQPAAIDLALMLME